MYSINNKYQNKFHKQYKIQLLKTTTTENNLQVSWPLLKVATLYVASLKVATLISPTLVTNSPLPIWGNTKNSSSPPGSFQGKENITISYR
jgi:hypothetical protein